MAIAYAAGSYYALLPALPGWRWRQSIRASRRLGCAPWLPIVPSRRGLRIHQMSDVCGWSIGAVDDNVVISLRYINRSIRNTLIYRW